MLRSNLATREVHDLLWESIKAHHYGLLNEQNIAQILRVKTRRASLSIQDYDFQIVKQQQKQRESRGFDL